ALLLQDRPDLLGEVLHLCFLLLGDKALVLEPAAEVEIVEAAKLLDLHDPVDDLLLAPRDQQAALLDVLELGASGDVAALVGQGLEVTKGAVVRPLGLDRRTDAVLAAEALFRDVNDPAQDDAALQGAVP